jgi:hypothetical protein
VETVQGWKLLAEKQCNGSLDLNLAQKRLTLAGDI